MATTPCTTPAAEAGSTHHDPPNQPVHLHTDTRRLTLIVRALQLATASTGNDRDGTAAASSDHRHAAHSDDIQAWRDLAGQLHTLSTAGTAAPTPAVVFDPAACRAWLEDGVAEAEGIDDEFCTTDLSIPAGLERLLAALDDDPQPQVWRTVAPLREVMLWRTADGDGVDGGAIITADLDLSGERLRLATVHQGFDEFTDDADLCGIDAAVQALGTIAARVNEELAVYTHAMRAPRLAISPAAGGHTVLGVWIGDEPVPVGVVGGQHQVSGGAEDRFPGGLWATSMPADDPDVAEWEAIAQMRATVQP